MKQANGGHALRHNHALRSNHTLHSRHTLRRGFIVVASAVLTAGMALSAVPSTAQQLPAIEEFDVADAAAFPADAFGGERTASASDALLLTDPATGLTFRRNGDKNFTGLDADSEHGDAKTPAFPGRKRIAAKGASASGRISAPFAERGLTLSLVDEGVTETGPLLQLAPTSDDAEYDNGFTTLSEETSDPPTTGKTYLLRTKEALPNTDPNATAALTAVPTAENEIWPDPNELHPVDEHGPLRTQQWTVHSLGADADGNALFQLVNRGDGTCFASDPPKPAGTPTTLSVCDAGDLNQTWRMRELPDPVGPGVTLYNIGTESWLLYGDADDLNDPTFPAGPVGYNPTENLPPNAAGGSQWTWQEVQQQSPIPGTVAFRAQDGADFPFDLATGDLDGVASSDGAPRDEAAVAYAKADGTLAISVVDYAESPSLPRVTELEKALPPVAQADRGLSYGRVTVNIADLDGDGVGEIVAAFPSGAKNDIAVVAARYSHADDGSVKVTMLGSPVNFGAQAAVDGRYGADAAVADFDGDGTQELAWAGGDAVTVSLPTLWTAALTLTDDDALAVKEETKTQLSTSGAILPVDAGFNARVNVESGQFYPSTSDSGLRQIAVTWEDPKDIWAGVYSVSQGATTAEARFTPVPIPGAKGSDAVSLAVGGFAAAGQSDSLMWGLAVSPIGGTDQKDSVTLIQPQAEQTSPTVTTLSVTPANGESAHRSGYELASWDRLGKSLILGSPVTFTVQQLVNLNLVGGQPPAHSDWLNGQFVNISRNQDFSLTMGSSTSAAYENSTSQESNQALGLSLSSNMAATVEGGVPLFGKAGGSVEAGARLDVSWKSMGTALRALSASQSASVTQSTKDDDIVNAKVQDYRIYRYPVFSADTWDRTDAAETGCEDGCFGYWDVVLPGEVHDVNGSGKPFTFFQPSWQNGNALSYPVLKDGKVVLDDLGPYSYTDGHGATVTITAPLVNQEFAISSSTSTQKLDMSQAASTGSTEQSEIGWGGNAELEAGVSAEVKIPGFFDSDVSGSLRGGFNASASFVDTITSSTSNAHDSSFALDVPAVDGNRGYAFGTAYYYDEAGTPHVTYGVDLTSNNQSKEWWLTNYGQQPDPALNLPYSTILTYNARGYLGLVQWNSLTSRQEIRGFTARMPYSDNSDDAATSGATYARGPQPGDPVVFDVDVANYSLKPLTKPFEVTFYAVPTDADFISKTGDAVRIGTATVPSLGAQQHTTVSSPQWEAKGAVKSADHGLGQNWRIVVVLDEDDDVDEIHEWKGTSADICPADTVQDEGTLIDPLTGETETLVCGQNNQGYGKLTVLPEASNAAASGKMKAAASDTDAAKVSLPANVKLFGAGVITATADARELTPASAVPQLTTGQPSTVLLRAKADRTSPGYQTVIVYDGPPGDGNAVAVTRMLGVPGGGAGVASFQYTPQTDGLHELHAVILGNADAGGDSGLIVRLSSTTPDTSNAGGEDGNGQGGTATTPPASGGQDNGTNGEAAGGFLPVTGGEAWPWLLLGLGGMGLIGAGLAVRGIRRHRAASAEDEG